MKWIMNITGKTLTKKPACGKPEQCEHLGKHARWVLELMTRGKVMVNVMECEEEMRMRAT